MKYIYCPKCGRKLTDRKAGDDGKIPYCETCKKFWFDSFSDCTIVLVANELGEIALLRQGYLSDKYATFVSGYIKPGETAEETSMREVKEEIGVDLDSLAYGGTYWFGKNDMLMHGFIGYAKKVPLKLSEEVDSAEWLAAEETENVIFPDSPGNAQYALYKQYMRTLTRGDDDYENNI